MGVGGDDRLVEPDQGRNAQLAAAPDQHPAVGGVEHPHDAGGGVAPVAALGPGLVPSARRVGRGQRRLAVQRDLVQEQRHDPTAAGARRVQAGRDRRAFGVVGGVGAVDVLPAALEHHVQRVEDAPDAAAG